MPKLRVFVEFEVNGDACDRKPMQTAINCIDGFVIGGQFVKVSSGSLIMMVPAPEAAPDSSEATSRAA